MQAENLEKEWRENGGEQEEGNPLPGSTGDGDSGELQPIQVVLKNKSKKQMRLFWDDGGEGVAQGEVPPGEHVSINTFPGHAFIWKSNFAKDRSEHRIEIKAGTTEYSYHSDL